MTLVSGDLVYLDKLWVLSCFMRDADRLPFIYYA
jgi:hypothetical protein